MVTVEDIMAIYPELNIKDFSPQVNKIRLQDDGDGIVYIAEWNYDQPIPEGLSLGKP